MGTIGEAPTWRSAAGLCAIVTAVPEDEVRHTKLGVPSINYQLARFTIEVTSTYCISIRLYSALLRFLLSLTEYCYPDRPYFDGHFVQHASCRRQNQRQSF